jgi:protein-S-isoprenylcysteine O-methyltransferase Ste14
VLLVPAACICVATGYLRHPQYGGLLMAAFGIAIITRSETRLAVAALLWFVLDRKVRCCVVVEGARVACLGWECCAAWG